MATKQGELRVQKGGVIYGPMTREAFDRLLVDGKIARTDVVSVRGGEWIEISAFMLTPADDVSEDATLRLLAGQRMFSSLSRRQVEQLCAAGRVDDDDLICALNGPWMRVGDFFAPPAVAATAPHTSTPSVAPPTVSYQPTVDDDAPQATADLVKASSGARAPTGSGVPIHPLARTGAVSVAHDRCPDAFARDVGRRHGLLLAAAGTA